MHVLISNHAAEINAYRKALAALSVPLHTVENNLSALSLIGSRAAEIESLVITDHQDQAVNIETPIFVQQAAKLLDGALIVTVGAPQLASPDAEVVETIAAAADLVKQYVDLEPVAVATEAETAASNGHAVGNGHAPLDLHEFTATHTFAPAAQETVQPETVQPNFVQPETVQPTLGAEQVPLPQVMTEIPESAQSLADDIRDWTERNEQERGKKAASMAHKTFGQRLSEMLPANRRLREEEARLDAAIRAPRLARCHSIAVISPKGGVGKSFLTYLIGNFLAEVRGDKAIAIDTNPDFGTLADQVRGRESQTVSTLLEQIQSIKHYSDLRRFTSKVESRLEVLAAPADPDVMATIGAQDYGKVFEQLHHYYDTVLFDCGTGFRDDITRFALKQCDQIVLVSAPLFITTGIVIRAMGYLDQIGCDLSRVTLAINQVRREKPLDLDYMRSRFGSRLNAIVEIPFDLQLYHAMDRGEFSVDHTEQRTRNAVKQLVAELVRHFE